MELSGKRVLVTGGYGFIGKHVLQTLDKEGVKADTFHRADYDLRDYEQCYQAIRDLKSDVIFHLAATVGGIGANQSRPADFWADNLEMGLNILRASEQLQVEKVIMVGSICCYPKNPPHIPFQEEDLFQGYPEETNAPYGIAKLSLLVGAQAYRKQYGLNVITLLPTNLYGPGDNFDPQTSHVIPALIRKVLLAQDQGDSQITIWGSGTPSRCFLYAEDAALGLVKAARDYDRPDPVNLASKDVITIRDLVNLISDIVGWKGEVLWDQSKPDGQPVRSVDTSKAKNYFGFVASTPFRVGLQKTIDWYREVRGE